MITRPCVLVAGMPRTGTTLMMNLLAASGFLPIAESSITLETDLVLEADLTPISYPYFVGRAMKVLNCRPKMPAGAYDIVMMDRDAKECAESSARMPGGPGLTASQYRHLVRNHQPQVEEVRDYWESIGPVHTCRLENLLRDPAGEVRRLIDIGCPLSSHVHDRVVRSA